MTLRDRVRGGLRKVGHTTEASAQNPYSGMPLALKKISSPSMATPKAISYGGLYAHSQPVATNGWFGFRVSLS